MVQGGYRGVASRRGDLGRLSGFQPRHSPLRPQAHADTCLLLYLAEDMGLEGVAHQGHPPRRQGTLLHPPLRGAVLSEAPVSHPLCRQSHSRGSDAVSPRLHRESRSLSCTPLSFLKADHRPARRQSQAGDQGQPPGHDRGRAPFRRLSDDRGGRTIHQPRLL